MKPGAFCVRTIDDRRALLERGYRLRYQVYCVERKFLRAEDYPDGLEIDRFDRHAIHVGAIDMHGDLAGTARVVRPSEIGLPIFERCEIYPHETRFHAGNPRLVEVGRLSVSRSYRRRRSDSMMQAGPIAAPGAGPAFRDVDARRQHQDVFQALLKGLYQASNRAGATHWLAATEKSLQRMLTQRGFPFHQIGPERDYFGLVAPYQMDLQEFEEVVASGRFAGLDDFLEGLEPRQPGDAVDEDAFVHARDGSSPAAARAGAV
jgi:N-acyl amino acid synthase of PEP-CTERM/exosortase system